MSLFQLVSMLAQYSVMVKEKHMQKRTGKQAEKIVYLCLNCILWLKEHYGAGKGMDKWNGEQLEVIKIYFYVKNDQSFWTLKRVRGK